MCLSRETISLIGTMGTFRIAHAVRQEDAQSASSVDSDVNEYDPNLDSDTESDTGSLDGYNLSFEERIYEIRDLCMELWPNAQHSKTLIEGSQEGFNNRVYPITITEYGITRRYVLRIPRVPCRLKQTIWNMEYIEQVKGELPLPALITYHLDHNNPLGYPYMVLERVPGKDLSHVYSTLTHQQKIALAKKVGVLYQQLQAVTNPFPGWIDEGKDGPSSEPWLRPMGIDASWMKVDPGVEKMRDESLTPKTLCTEPWHLSCKDVFLLAFKRRLCHGTEANDGEEIEYAEMAIEKINHIARNGLLDDRVICLWHMDLFPRNIMVDVETNPDDPVITGVVDWDYAAFAPQFVACPPPYWLWGPDDFEAGCLSEMSSQVGSELCEPARSQGAEAWEIKQAFDMSVGGAYRSKAYDPGYVTIRQLLSLEFCL